MSETRDAYVKRMKAQLDEWNADIDKLQSKAKKAEARAQIRYDQQIHELRRLTDEARARLEQARSAGDEAWEELRQGFESSWETVREAFREMKEPAMAEHG